MLVIVRVDVRGDPGAVRTRLAVCADIDLQDTGETNLEFDATILVEMVVPDVLCPSVSKG